MTNKELSTSRTFIMGVAMIAIMLFHNQYATSVPYIGEVFKRYGYLGVDLFLLVSGFGIANSLNKNGLKQFYYNRFIRIIPACIICGGGILLIDRYLHIEQSKAPHIFRLLSLQKWYIQAILTYYILSPFIKGQIVHYGIKFILFATIASLVFSIMVPNIGFIKISWILNRFPVYCIGMYLGLFDFPKNKKQLVLYQGALLTVSIMMLTFCGTNKILGHIGLILWGFSVPLVVSILSKLFNKCKRGPICLCISLFGTFSLEIYLVHEYIYWYSYTIDRPFIRMLLTIILIIGAVCMVHYTSKFISNVIRSNKFSSV